MSTTPAPARIGTAIHAAQELIDTLLPEKHPDLTAPRWDRLHDHGLHTTEAYVVRRTVVDGERVTDPTLVLGAFRYGDFTAAVALARENRTFDRPQGGKPKTYALLHGIHRCGCDEAAL